MSDGLPYLFAAFGITWLAFFAYAFATSRRLQELERRLRSVLGRGSRLDEPRSSG